MQSLTPQQIIDLQGQLSDDQASLVDVQAQLDVANQRLSGATADVQIYTNKIASLNQRITDAQAVLNQVNAP